jgi:hypothetical protein
LAGVREILEVTAYLHCYLLFSLLLATDKDLGHTSFQGSWSSEPEKKKKKKKKRFEDKPLAVQTSTTPPARGPESCFLFGSSTGDTGDYGLLALLVAFFFVVCDIRGR